MQQDMDVIGNNIANINTTGFKAGVVNFGDSFSDTLEAANGASSQIGTGVMVQDIASNFNPGAVNNTGVTTDLAISGNGFFVVQDPTTGAQFVTQDGTFSVNASGNLVTASGMEVMGTNGTSSTLIPVTILPPATAAAGVTVSTFTINPQGQINAVMSDNSTATVGQVMLQNFQDPNALISQPGNMYSNQANAGPIQSTPSAPGSAGLGSIESGYVEISNVDLSTEMANLITAQRGFEANSKIVTTSDQLLQTMVNLKQG